MPPQDFGRPRDVANGLAEDPPDDRVRCVQGVCRNCVNDGVDMDAGIRMPPK